VTGIGAAVGVPAIAVSTTLVVGGVGNIATAARRREAPSLRQADDKRIQVFEDICRRGHCYKLFPHKYSRSPQFA
jgi:hypothetical protein